MEILNRPNCMKCGEPALTLIYGKWLCGPCLKEGLDKIKEKNKELMFE